MSGRIDDLRTDLYAMKDRAEAAERERDEAVRALAVAREFHLKACPEGAAEARVQELETGIREAREMWEDNDPEVGAVLERLVEAKS